MGLDFSKYQIPNPNHQITNFKLQIAPAYRRQGLKNLKFEII